MHHNAPFPALHACLKDGVRICFLGRAGIFDRFRMCFDDPEKKLYLYEKAYIGFDGPPNIE